MRTLKQSVCFTTMLCLSVLAAASQQSPAPASKAIPTDSTAQAITYLKQHQPAKAFDLLTKAITEHPDDAASNLLAASTAIELEKPDLAVTYGERARALEPDNWKIHTTLVTAYAMAGKIPERNAERATLRAVHAAGNASDAKQASGFLLDRFTVKNYRIDAVEYFSPVGKFHIYYCFFVRNTHGQRVWQINAQSDDYNQASWAKTYPKQAAEGQRQFQLTGEGSGVRNDYRTFSGSPEYDWIKARVIDIVNAQSVPFPGESTAPIT